MRDLTFLQRFSWRITLTDEETDRAWEIGKGRHQANKNKNDRKSYKTESLMKDNTLAQVHAAAAEIGAKNLLGAEDVAPDVWNAKDHWRYKNMGDAKLGDLNLEFKWRRLVNGAKGMPVDRKDYDANRLVLWTEAVLKDCDCESCGESRTETRVRLLGGGYAQQLWPLGNSYNGDNWRVRVPAKYLTPIYELFEDQPA